MIIYKITNIVNGKFYIGKTIKTLEERFYRHKFNSKKGSTYLYKALRKYGIENFTIEIVETVSDISILNDREKFWIEKLKPQYNLTEGGDGGDTTKSENYWNGMQKYHSSVDRTKIKPSRGMQGKKQSEKFFESIKKHNSCPVSCEGKYFDSVGDAQKFYTGISIRKRLDNPNYPDFFRLKEKTKRK